MKKNIFYILSFLFALSYSVLAQVPASQDTIWIPGGAANIGSIENTINGDTTAGAVRINPNRIYMLSADSIYYVQAQILFGSATDSTATLNIIGQTGGTLPVIEEVPVANGGNAFTDQIDGNLTVANVYWQAISQVNNSKADIFGIYTIGRRLIMTNVVTQYGGNNMFGFQNGHSKMYLYGCCFRDMNWFQNSWNSTIYANGGMDTCWVENCTMEHTGLGLYLNHTIKFMYFNHNTWVDATKYGITEVQYQTAYFTNNLFINQDWEGECSGTEWTQNDTHTFLGTACIDSTSGSIAESKLWMTEQGYVPAQNSVIYLNSNNVHFTDTCLNQYYNGNYLTAAQKAAGFHQPLSNRSNFGQPPSWLGDSTLIVVQNIPPLFISGFTWNLADAYPNIKIDAATISYADPGLKTPAIQQFSAGGIHTQAALDNMVWFSETNYGVQASGQTYDPGMFAFSDYDNPGNLPGPGGKGITTRLDLNENFSYSANLTSTIDGLKLGDLNWWSNGVSGWNSQAEYQKVANYYSSLTSVKETNNNVPSNYALAQNYPNPFNPATTIEYSIAQNSLVTLKVYNVLGQEVASLVNQEQKAGSYSTSFDASRLASGLYFYKIQAGSFTMTKKMLLLK